MNTNRTAQQQGSSNNAAIVIADDQERERTWLRELLTQRLVTQGQKIYEAEDGQRAFELVREHKPSLVFLDIEMPVMSGVKSAARILKKQPQIPIVILSNHSVEVFVRQLWKMAPPTGAFGYVLKDSTDQQVIDAAHAVLGGDGWIHPRIQRIARRTENGATGLTEAEFEVLIFISIGFTDRAIATRLYITDKAVQARLKCLYTKLGISTKGASEDDEYNHRCRALNLAFRRGLINRGRTLRLGGARLGLVCIHTLPVVLRHSARSLNTLRVVLNTLRVVLKNTCRHKAGTN
ncbi:MAG: response regulator transcription factor [Candidatus Obscuribacterales bacterium]|nr:response regulator transcription factor [Candidatus Obscuribacterales bacterium]